VQQSAQGATHEFANRQQSNEKLQIEALDLLTEVIRRNLLTASVHILDPPCSLSRNILEAYTTGSRDMKGEEILYSYMSGVLPRRKRWPHAPVKQQFRLPPKAEAEVRAQLAFR